MVRVWIISLLMVAAFGAKGVLIPFYHYPSVPDPEVERLVALKRSHPHVKILAVINPNNGRFDEEQSNFAKMIERLSSNGVITLGYIHTSYGERPLSEVIENVENWKEYYKKWGISGIFIDEVDCDKVGYYKKLSDKIKESFDLVVANPGVLCEDADWSDIVVIHENFNYDLDLSKIPSAFETAVLVHSTYQFDPKVFERVDYFYATPYGGGNPWGKLSPYLRDIVDRIEAEFQKDLNKKAVKLQERSHE